MLVRKHGFSLKQEGKIYVCYVRPVLSHCCATLKLTVANEATFHRLEHRIIYIYYICIYHILSYTEYVPDIKSVSHGI